ncbi:MAG: ABC transporter substrate-binding protein [Gemmatimonadota bacterium]|nr:ABC transporter substrate-binding protein [Gemmatimonadota bacterium]
MVKSCVAVKRPGVPPVAAVRSTGLARPAAPRSRCPGCFAHRLLAAVLIGSVFACATGTRDPATANTDVSGAGAGDDEAAPDSAGMETTEAEMMVETADPVSEESFSAELVIGAVLPVSGSPSNREYARLFIEGLEVGALLARQNGVNIEVVVEDNLGTASGSARGVDALMARGALAVIGPLDADNVRAAVRAAPRELAFFSPTATQLPYGRRGVYSLAAGDPEAGRTLAQAVWDLGYADVVIVHPRSSRESIEMDAFQRAFPSLGGFVRRRIRYPPGTTTFEEYLTQAKALKPSVLIVAAPPADVELLAPQIAFFGLDELELQVAGTAGWTDPLVVEGLPRRHTEGVVAVSATPPGEVRQPPPEFVAAYETLFRRSLASMIPAAGFDLLGMALDAHRQGARTSREVIATLERLAPFEGVTGTYSFTDGRLTREFYPVRILSGGLHPVDADSTLIPPFR